MRVPIIVNMFPLPDQLMYIEEEDKDNWERMCNPKSAEDYSIGIKLYFKEQDVKESGK